ncbi:RNA polymerase sigma factor [Pleomorphovibrio marinus]|uniref:RNA polymerase sigma factor n=1 Tax=Pleomorphovibrio marinus TaxID=2164132 RepID=UPI00130045E3|nr:sigma-70 family RNA polymerase sigma factor [Pleomorphovibrio marinus]
MNSKADQTISEEAFCTEDQLFWQIIKAGDPKGLERFYEKYAEELFSFGMNVVSEKELVKDCIQEVFLELWRYRSSLNSIRNFRLYLFKCLRNRIFHESAKIRLIKPIEDVPVHNGQLQVEAEETNLIASQIELEKQEAMADALRKLPDRQKEVIQYLFFESFTYEQTSDIMGINVQSVYTLAWKALNRLKKHYSKGVALFCLFQFF